MTTVSANVVAPKTWIEAVLPMTQKPSWATDIALIVGASLVIALLAQIAIPLPFTPVPITGQTFGVLLMGILLGWRRAGVATLLYLTEGAVGLPFFAGGSAGLAKFAGPTAGYLFAFPIAAILTGWLAERGWDRSPRTAGLAMLFGSVLILVSGTVVLSFFVGGLVPAIAQGLLPFVPGDLFKTTLAALLLPTLWKTLPQKTKR